MINPKWENGQWVSTGPVKRKKKTATKNKKIKLSKQVVSPFGDENSSDEELVPLRDDPR